jgi:hypothetical protein
MNVSFYMIHVLSDIEETNIPRFVARKEERKIQI